MGFTKLAIASGMLAATSPVLAAQPEPTSAKVAPAAAADARYCLRLEPVTGTRIETIRCETRDAWSQLGVDVDREWAEEGVRVIGPEGYNT